MSGEPRSSAGVLEVEQAEAFAQAHANEPQAWVNWAHEQPGQVRLLFRRITADAFTARTRPLGEPTAVEQFDLSIPGLDDLSPQLRSMIETALGAWGSDS